MKFMIRTIPAILAGLFVTSIANATTAPMSVGDFNATPSQALQTKITSWRDPAFGDMGWTHSSAWGKFTATAGQEVTITAVSSNVKLHPAISVWYRGTDDTAADNYVADHFYAQNANQYVKGATDETTGAALGDIAMKIVKYGFDKDLNPLTTFFGGGIKDTVSGTLVLKFKVKTTGSYMFVLGGFSKAVATLDSSLKYPVQTTVSITTPTTP